jgi:hypothetical protein
MFFNNLVFTFLDFHHEGYKLKFCHRLFHKLTEALFHPLLYYYLHLDITTTLS